MWYDDVDGDDDCNDDSYPGLGFSNNRLKLLRVHVLPLVVCTLDDLSDFVRLKYAVCFVKWFMMTNHMQVLRKYDV